MGMGNPLTSPPEIEPFIERSVRTVTNREPVFLDLVFVRGAMQSECFTNVIRQAAAHGGETIFGWIIWHWPGVMIDMEHHAIWEKPNGTWQDITPKADGEEHILFVRDDTANYVNGRSLLNKRFPATDNRMAKDYVALKGDAERALEPFRTDRGYHIPPYTSPDIVQRIQKKQERANRIWRRLHIRFGDR